MLKGKKILLGISGSIAAYKSAVLIRLLIKAGAEVKVVMTSAATQFIGPLTLSTLSKNTVLVDLSSEDTWANHVMLGRWADVMLIAPLSCNTLSKMANGACDNLLMAVYLSATCPVVVAPAMDEDMWHHPSTKKNIKTLKQYGNHIIPVVDGELASGLVGMGRMAEPESIISWLNDFFKSENQLLNRNILITAGPTHEPIDPVRFIGNHASGKMGIALAIACKKRGANVTLVCGPTSESIPKNIHVEFVQTANEMYDKCHAHFSNCDMAIMAAAVADYTIKSPSEIKIKKVESTITLGLEKTKDILKSLGEIKKENQILVGFALETNNEIENAISKLKSKNADFIVLNSLNDAGAGFGHQTNKITIFDKLGNQFNFDQKLKSQVAEDILNTILKIKHV
jgi:phosphopantothenoylcysteine decarboxylase/phosphopantothenate--cysteine ligase